MGLILGSGQTRPQFPYDQWYGVEGDFSSDDYVLTRVGNLDLHRTLPIQNKMRRFVENTDGSVKYYLHDNDSRKDENGMDAVLDGSDGNVMLEIPEHYFKFEIKGTKWLYAISEYQLPGFIRVPRRSIAPWYSTYNAAGDTAISGCWLTWDGDNIARDENGLVIFQEGAPRGGGNRSSYDDTYRSEIGMPRTNANKATVRGKCVNGTHIGAYRAYNTIAWLQRIEYASLNCQSTYNAALTEDGFHQGGLGSGPAVVSGEWNTHNGYYPFVPCGVTLPLGNNTGRLQYTIKNWAGSGNDKTVYVTSYRGFETPFEYLWMLADDVLAWHKSDKSIIFVCDDPTKFTSHSNSAESAPDGYEEICELPRTSDYGKTLYTSREKGYSFINRAGGAANKGTCDYFYSPVTASFSDWGWYGSLLSAGAISGARAGLGYLNASYRSSSADAYHGFRLCRS